MSGDAGSSPEVTKVRENVPEFESAFQEELRAEDGEMGPFQAMSLLAEWTRERLRNAPDDEPARRAFDAVEQLITDEQLHMGDALAAEFIEGIWDHPDADELMGPKTRERAQPR
jgi:hypothetical protein